MKAISIKQPWATLIARGEKTIEVRSWQTKYRGDLLICASAKPDNWMKATKTFHQQRGNWLEAVSPLDSDFEDFYFLGRAICIAELFEVSEFKPEHELDALVDYSPGFFAWHLRNIRPVKNFEVKGKLGFFEVNI